MDVFEMEQVLRGYWDGYPAFVNNPEAIDEIVHFITAGHLQGIEDYENPEKELDSLLSIFNHAAGSRLYLYNLPAIYDTLKQAAENKKTPEIARLMLYRAKAKENSIDVLLDAYIAGVPVSDIIC